MLRCITILRIDCQQGSGIDRQVLNLIPIALLKLNLISDVNPCLRGKRNYFMTNSLYKNVKDKQRSILPNNNAKILSRSLKNSHLERHLLRQKQAALLETQKMAIREREYALDEERKRKVQRERIVEFYADEITKSIMQEHILEVDASVLATFIGRRYSLGSYII